MDSDLETRALGGDTDAQIEIADALDLDDEDRVYYYEMAWKGSRSTDAGLALADVYRYFYRDFDKAIEIYHELEPRQNSEVLNILGDLHENIYGGPESFETPNLLKARDYYQKAIKVDPDDMRGYSHMGQLYADYTLWTTDDPDKPRYVDFAQPSNTNITRTNRIAVRWYRKALEIHNRNPLESIDYLYKAEWVLGEIATMEKDDPDAMIPWSDWQPRHEIFKLYPESTRAEIRTFLLCMKRLKRSVHKDIVPMIIFYIACEPYES